MPLFITSDSLLNAYHVLSEESIRQLEIQRAKKMPEILRCLTDNLQAMEIEYEGDPALPRAARKRAVLVLGVALRLLDDGFALQDPELNAILEEEVERVRNAQGSSKPEWLGPPDPGFTAIDYSRYKPRGFYVSSELLQNYFQSVAWLQSIPFRLNNDEEFLAFLCVAKADSYIPPDEDPHKEFLNTLKHRSTERFWRTYVKLLGSPDDWDLALALAELDVPSRFSEGIIAAVRKDIHENPLFVASRPKINDQVAYPAGEGEAAQEPSFRIQSAYRTPSAVLFQKTTNQPGLPGRAFPEGLEVAAALGSEFARQKLTYRDKDALLTLIDMTKPEFAGEALYHTYLSALTTLLDEPPEQAPAFMSTLAWQAKSCNTALGGWAQLRHTWVLQAKQSVSTLSATMVPPGFVEPDPEFFGQMGFLAERSIQSLKAAGAFSSAYDDLMTHLEDAASMMKDVKTEAEAKDLLETLLRNDMATVDLLFSLFKPWSRDNIEKDIARMRESIKQLVDMLKEDGRALSARERRIVDEHAHQLKPLWEQLATMCRELELISYKQLFGTPLNDRDNGLIRFYGESLAGIMFYGGNSYYHPRDDAPRIVDVFSNPNFSPITYLEAGIARPRKMYVLYPWGGGEVLCVGAVLPYYEFRSTERLTDAQWLELLDCDLRPLVPDWAKPIYKGEGLGKPEMVGR